MYGERASSPPRRGRDMAPAPVIGYPQGRIRPFCGVVRPLSLGRMTQVYDPCTHERPIWPPPLPTSPIQRAMAWAVWPCALDVPVLAILWRNGMGVFGWITITFVVTALPLLCGFGVPMAVLVTVRAALVTPFSAGPWTTYVLLLHWLCVVVLFLGLGDGGDSPESAIASPSEQWGLPAQTADGLGEAGFPGTFLSAVAALIAASIELAQVRKAHLRAIFAGPGGNLPVPHATGGRHIPIAGTVPRDGTGPREMNPKRE